MSFLHRQRVNNDQRLADHSTVRQCKPKQSGVVMVTAILIIAVISALAINLIESSYHKHQKTQFHAESEQLQHLARATEEFGIQILYWDNWFDAMIWHKDPMDYDLPRPSLEAHNPLGYDPHNDSSFETWSVPRIPDFLRGDITDDFVSQEIMHITDLNRYFNINNLHFANSADVRLAYEANVRIFRSLLSRLVDPDIDTERLTDNIIDWLDHDNDSRSEILLTETDLYRRAGSSYRPANRPVNSIAELQHVLGMTPEIMNRLSSFVVSLPVYTAGFAPRKLAFSPAMQAGDISSNSGIPELTRININTCPPELLMALFALGGDTSGQATALEKQGYFQNINKAQALEVATVFGHDGVYSGNGIRSDKAGQDSTPVDSTNVIELVTSEYSEFFLVESYFQKKNGVSFNHESLIYKDRIRFNDLPKVIQRQFDWLPLAQK